jgi:hypothetical protein
MSKWWKHIKLMSASHEFITAEVELYRCLRRVNEIIDEHTRMYNLYMSTSHQLDHASEEELWSQVTEVVGSSNKLATLGNTMCKLSGEGLSHCSIIRQTLPVVLKHYEQSSKSETERLNSLHKWVSICESHLQHTLNDMRKYKIKTEIEEERYYGEILGLKGRITREDINRRYEKRLDDCQKNLTGQRANPFNDRLTELEKLQLECAYSFFRKKYSF